MSPDRPARYDFSCLNVMVVEDNEHMQKLLRTILRAIGVRNVFEVSTGAEAFRELGRFGADVLISDWNMEPMNGLDLARMVRRDENSPNPYVPIVMVTGHAETSRVIEARDAGVNMFLVKPVSVKTLSERLAALVDEPARFVRTDTYFGPDRRRRNLGPPEGMPERRKNRID